MKKILTFLILLVSSLVSRGNNVLISNVSIMNNGPSNIVVKFDVSWDNSWRTNVGPNNYDGVWVFFKYKTASGNWTHMTMTGSNNTIPVGFDVYQTNDFLKIGAMIYRESTNMGSGTASAANVQLGVISTLPYDIEVKGFAIEMVYVPGPSTRPYFGDGDGANESINALHYTDNTATTGSVLQMKCDVNTFDDAELETDGIYIYSNDTIQTTVPLGTLDAFPTMKAVWCMKYEVSQAAYRDFLNTLTYTQQTTRTTNAPNSVAGTGVFTASGTNRNGLEIKTPGVASTTPAVYGCDLNNNSVYDEAADGEWITCNYLAWPDIAAYLDWSGLAPMSELQFERMCRGSSSAGPQPAIYGEYAWGTTQIFSSVYSLTGGGTASEIASNASVSVGNAAYGSTSSTGPLRNGIFATASSTRETSGATFYGIMEMSGSMYEYCIMLGSVAGRSCEFVPNGNGNISSLGNAQLSVGGNGYWPGMEGNGSNTIANTCGGTCEVTASAGLRVRGGSITDTSPSLSISDRGSVFTPTARGSNRGGRGVLNFR